MFIPLIAVVIIELLIVFPMISWLLMRRNFFANFVGGVIGISAVAGTVVFTILTLFAVFSVIFLPVNKKKNMSKNGAEYLMWVKEFPKTNGMFVHFYYEKNLVAVEKARIRMSFDEEKLETSNCTFEKFLYFIKNDSNKNSNDISPDGFEISVKNKKGKVERWRFIRNNSIGKSYWRISKDMLAGDGKLPNVFNYKRIKNFDELRAYIESEGKKNLPFGPFHLFSMYKLGS